MRFPSSEGYWYHLAAIGNYQHQEKGRAMRNRGLAGASGWLIAALLCWTGTTEAATYKLQVASVPERVFMHFVEDRTLPRIEAYLDTRRSKFVLFRDRRPQAVALKGPGQSGHLVVNDALPKRNDPWGATTWEGEAGQLAVFRVRGIQSDHQKLVRVAALRDGVLTRIPVRGIPGSRLQPMQAPAAAAGYLIRALESGTFLAWVERRAVSHDGLSVIVGKHHNAQESDTVYLVVRMPQTGRTYKVVLGWKTVKREGAYAITQRKRN